MTHKSLCDPRNSLVTHKSHCAVSCMWHFFFTTTFKVNILILYLLLITMFNFGCLNLLYWPKILTKVVSGSRSKLYFCEFFNTLVPTTRRQRRHLPFPQISRKFLLIEKDQSWRVWPFILFPSPFISSFIFHPFIQVLLSLTYLVLLCSAPFVLTFNNVVKKKLIAIIEYTTTSSKIIIEKISKK